MVLHGDKPQSLTLLALNWATNQVFSEPHTHLLQINHNSSHHKETD